MSGEAGDEFLCAECFGMRRYCRACRAAPDWFVAACREVGVDEFSPFAEATHWTATFYTNDIARGLRVLTAAGRDVCDGFGAAYALGGKDGALGYLRGLGLPGIETSGYYVEFPLSPRGGA